MSFDKFYFKKNELQMPLNIDLEEFNKSGDIRLNLDMRYMKEYVEHKFLKLKLNDKEFDTLEEAYKYHDSLNEDVTDIKRKGTDYAVKLKDPESGEERSFDVSLGNIKVGGDTIVLNLSTAHECMSLIIGTCSLGANGQCYALSFEKMYKDSLAKSKRQSEQWSCLTPKAIAEALDKISKKYNQIKYLRLNVSGEFRNLPSDPNYLAKVPDQMKAKLADVDDVGKLKKVGEELLKMNSVMKIYTYTHRQDLKFDMPENVCINGSGYLVHNAFMPLEYDVFNKVLDQYEAGTLKEINGEKIDKIVRCMGDCRKCNYCKFTKGWHILIAIHGGRSKTHYAMKNIINSVIILPDFLTILSKDIDDKAKAKELLNLLSDENKKLLQRIVPVLFDRIDLFEKLIQSKGNVELFTKAIEYYVSSSYGNEKSINVNITQDDQKEALIASVDNLIGKFERNQIEARKGGFKTGEQKWAKLAKLLQQTIEKAKGGKFKASPTLSKEFSKIHSKG